MVSIYRHVGVFHVKHLQTTLLLGAPQSKYPKMRQSELFHDYWDVSRET
jgi:hypothetical protein